MVLYGTVRRPVVGLYEKADEPRKFKTLWISW